MQQTLTHSQQDIDTMNAYLDFVQRGIDKHYDTYGNQIPKPINELTDGECDREKEKLLLLIETIADGAKLFANYN